MTQFIEPLISPVGIMVLLLAGGLALSCRQRSRAWGRRLLCGGAALFLLYLFSPLASLLMFGLENDYQPLLHPPEQPRVNKILILSGYARERPGFPITSLLTERTIGNLVEGLRLYRLSPEAEIIISGGVLHESERSVAAAMGDFLVQLGVPASKIRLEEKSQTTYENFLESRKLLGDTPFILVAQACDMRRAMAVARKLGMRPVPAPASYWTLQHNQGKSRARWLLSIFTAIPHASVENLFRLQWAYHEYVGYVWYQLRGRI